MTPTSSSEKLALSSLWIAVGVATGFVLTACIQIGSSAQEVADLILPYSILVVCTTALFGAGGTIAIKNLSQKRPHAERTVYALWAASAAIPALVALHINVFYHVHNGSFTLGGIFSAIFMIYCLVRVARASRAVRVATTANSS